MLQGKVVYPSGFIGMVNRRKKIRHWLVKLARVTPLLFVAALLGFTFRLYWFAYFWTDDFNNLFWVQQVSGRELFWHVINPGSHFFRPVGMAFYWLLSRCCDLDPVPFHALAWFLHCVNVGLTYTLLRRLTHTHFGAIFGAGMFACQAIFSDIYWSFGTIFELISYTFFLLALLSHSSKTHLRVRVLAVLVFFVLAVKGKEMAITLPLVIMMYDLLQPSSRKWTFSRRKLFESLITLAVLSVPMFWFTIRRTSEMGSADPSHPYYMRVSLLSLSKGIGWYVQTLFGTGYQPGYLIAALAIGYLFVKSGRPLLYFLLYVLVTLLPVVFLVNHRQDFYWYIPFLGVSGIAALAAKSVIEAFTHTMRPDYRLAVAIAIFGFLCREEYVIQKSRSAGYRWYFEGVSKQHRGFVEGLRALHPPPLGETLFFASAPMHLADSETLTAATQVALRRTDVRAQLVSTFPAHVNYRLGFEGTELLVAPAKVVGSGQGLNVPAAPDFR